MPSLRLRFRTLATLAAMLAATSAVAGAQDGRITGTVRDAFGSAREGARVTATHGVTGVVTSTTTSPNGNFVLADLAPGSYTVAASLIGFRRAVNANVQPGASVDLVLQPLPLQAVTVTATLREQELADVPFSVAAPTAITLRERGAETIEDIAANVAGFSVQNLGPGQSQVAIRGASAGQIARDQPGVKEQVGTYLDDSPISLSLFTPDLDLFDLNRVEVLRGPQGTLFGAGSLSGTVRYITNQPELGVNATFGEVGGSWIGGGSGGSNVRLGTNIPFGARTAARIALYHTRFGGWMDAVQPDFTTNENVNDGQRTGVRAAVRFQPSTGFSVTPRLVFQNVRMNGWNRIDAYNILANPYTTTRPRVTLGEREQFTQIEEPFSDDYVLGDLNVSYGLGMANLTSVTSWSTRDILVVRDAGALTSSITGGTIGLAEEIYTLNSPLNDKTDARVLTQEVRLSGGVDRARWLVGGFYSRSKREYGQILYVGGFEAASGFGTTGLAAQRDELFYSDLSYDLSQTAIFGEMTLGILPALDVTAGLRYYRFGEDRDQIFDGIFANDGTGDSLVTQPGSTKADGFAPRVIATLRAAPNVTFNAQASRGFRLGGINDPLNEPLCTVQDLATFRGRPTWEDETAWNYEVGVKSQWMGGMVGFNASAFRMDIENLQLNVTAGTCSSRLVFNVPKSVSQGAEIELNVVPNQFFDLALSGTFTNSELRSTFEAPGIGVVSGIEEGNRLPSVPRVQASAAATWRWPMSGGQSFLTGTYHHIGSRYTQIEDLTTGFGSVNLVNPAVFRAIIGGPLSQTTFAFDPELPAYNLVNARVGMVRTAWEVALFVNNVADERALLALDRERGKHARVGYLTNQPRTFGLTLGFHY